MATVQEHMLADFAYSLEEEGKSVIIDGVELKVHVSEVETDPANFELTGIILERLSHLPGALPEKHIGQVVTVNGERWKVVNHLLSSVKKTLTLERSIG